MKKVKIKKMASKKDPTLIYHYLDWGRQKGQRYATGEYTYKKPTNIIQENHNKDSSLRIEKLRAEKYQEINSDKEFNSADAAKLKSDFLAYYEKIVESSDTKRRNLRCSLDAFRSFVNKPILRANEITEKFGLEYRAYLLNKYNGETPGDYFQHFKNVCKEATKEKYFYASPVADIAAKKNESAKKDILDADEWKGLLETPCANDGVRRAAIFSLYSGLRWTDVKSLEWVSIKNNTLTKVQNKTERLVEVPLHPIALEVLGKIKKSGLVFDLPTSTGANNCLAAWARKAEIDKHLTWHSLRHTLSVFMQDDGISPQTVAGILGHRNSVQVLKTYTRYSSKQAKAAVDKLPSFNKTKQEEVSELDKQVELKKLELELLNKKLELARLESPKPTNPLRKVK